MLLATVPFRHGTAPEASAAGGWLVVVLLASLAAGCYLLAAGRYRALRGRPWSGWRTAAWATGVLLIGLALSPVAEEAARQPSAHMAQHVVLGMLAPLALVLGAPVTLALATTRPSAGRRISAVLRLPVVHVLTHPASAAVLAVGGMFVLYLTPLYALSLTDDFIHHAVHVHFVAAGYLYCWSIAGPDPAPRRPGLRTRVLVLVLAAAAHAFSAKLLYAHAATLPRDHPFDAAEMERAALWMYYGGDLAEVLLAATLLAAWYRRDGRRARAGHGRPPVHRSPATLDPR